MPKFRVDDRVRTVVDKTYGVEIEGYVTRILRDQSGIFVVVKPDNSYLQECLFREDQLRRTGGANPSNLMIVNRW